MMLTLMIIDESDFETRVTYKSLFTSALGNPVKFKVRTLFNTGETY
jgi:hypothetical protein